MGTSLTIEGFVSTLKSSGLVEPEGLDAILDDLAARPVRDPAPFADTLVQRGVLTEWQAGKILSGVQKGFFLGKHKVLRLVGEGAMSSVYEGEHMLMHRRVAIKVLCKSLVGEASYLERFYREARALAQLNHPNIVRGLDVGCDGERHYLVMEFVDGPSLEDLVFTCGPLPFEQAAEVIRQAALGLEHVHSAGFVHRDVKPSNIKIESKQIVKILDLGLVRSVIHDEREGSLTRRHDQKVLGTIDYLSPEQAVDGHVADIRSDVYSLGCTLYFLLTGSPPFPQGTLAEKLLAHQMRPPAPVTTLRPDVPESLHTIISKMVEKRREDRYATPGEVASVLAEWLNQRRRPSTPAGAAEPQPASAEPPDRTRLGMVASRAAVTNTDPSRINSSATTVGLPAPGPPTWAGPVRSPVLDEPSPSVEPEVGIAAPALVDQWRQWVRIATPIAAKQRTRGRADNRSYRLVYDALLQACRAERDTADAPTQVLLGRIEKLVSPWVSIHALRSFLKDSASSSFVERLQELDRELVPHHGIIGRWRVPILLGTTLLAWLAILLVWRDEHALRSLEIHIQDVWSSCWKLVGG